MSLLISRYKGRLTVDDRACVGGLTSRRAGETGASTLAVLRDSAGGSGSSATRSGRGTARCDLYSIFISVRINYIEVGTEYIRCWIRQCYRIEAAPG